MPGDIPASSRVPSGTTGQSGIPEPILFLYYDPYYDELVRRQRLYASQAATPKKSPSVSQRFRHDDRNVATPPGAATVTPKEANVNSASEPSRSEMLQELQNLKSELDTKKEELKEAHAKLESNERVIKSLYSELDRQRASVSELTARDIKRSKDLEQLRKQNKASGVASDYQELESKYLNAIELIDQLNWRLYQSSSAS